MRLRVTRVLVLAAYFALLVLQVIWHAWWHPSLYFPTALVLLVLAAPLLLPLRGLLHGRIRSHLWASFLMLLYFMHGVVEAYANPPQRVPALLEVGLSLTLFGAAILYVRWARAAEAGAAIRTDPAAAAGPGGT